MPNYDYGCNHCGFLWEDITQNINDSPKKKCPILINWQKGFTLIGCKLHQEFKH